MATKVISFDWAIKYFLRDKKNFDILEGFLSTLLNKDIKILELLESESNNLEDLKFNRVDLMVKTDDEHFIIEIQNSREVDYLERILYGTSKVIVENLKLGEKYRDIKKVISVNILYFNLGDGEDYIYHGKTEFTGMNKKDRLILRRRIFIDDKKFKLRDKNIFPEYYLIRVDHFEEIIGSPIDEWIYMFKNSEIKDNFKSKGMNSVKERLSYIKMTPQERRRYDNYLINLARELNIIETAEQDGYIKAMKETQEKLEKALQEKKKAIQREEKAQREREKAQEQVYSLVKLLLSMNTPIEIISEKTKLSIEAIEKIKKSI